MSITGNIIRTMLSLLRKALFLLAIFCTLSHFMPAQASQIAAPNPMTPFVVAINNDPDGLDPAITFDSNTILVTSQILETLVSYGTADMRPSPGLATGWTASPNGLTWTFTLRPGIKFHDGTDFDATAVVFNFNRWWDTTNPYHKGSFDYFQYIFGGFKGDPNCLITNVNAPDATHVTITLKNPYSPLPSTLGLQSFAISSPAAIQAGTTITKPVGTGPFTFVNQVIGDQILLNSNQSYWNGKPYFNSLTFKVITDDNNRFAALQANTVQSAYDLPNSFVSSAGADTNLKVLYRSILDTGYLGMNRLHPPLDNLMVRQAIAHAINRQHIISNFYGPGDTLAQQLVPSNLWGYDPTITNYTYDPALAHSLLVSAGFTHGITTTLDYRNVIRQYILDPTGVANAIKDDLLAVGITVTLNEYPSTTFLDKYNNGELNLFLIGWGADYPHPYDFLNNILCNSYLAYGSKDNTLCGMLQNDLTVTDFPTQLATYKAAGLEVNDTLPLLPLAQGRTPLIVRKNVAGVIVSPMNMDSHLRAFYASAFIYLPTVMR